MSLIIVNKGAAKEQDGKREVFHLSARKALQQEYDWRRKVLDGGESSAQAGGGSFKMKDRLQDPQEMRKQMEQYKKDIDRGAPVKMSAEIRNELWKKAKRLKDEFKVGMLSKDDLHPVKHKEIIVDGAVKTAVVVDRDQMRERKTVERNEIWHNKNKNKLREFKRIMRILEPDNPHIADYEKFRPRGRK